MTMNYIISIDTLDKRIGIRRFGTEPSTEMTANEIAGIAMAYDLGNWSTLEALCEDALTV